MSGKNSKLKKTNTKSKTGKGKKLDIKKAKKLAFELGIFVGEILRNSALQVKNLNIYKEFIKKEKIKPEKLTENEWFVILKGEKGYDDFVMYVSKSKNKKEANTCLRLIHLINALHTLEEDINEVKNPSGYIVNFDLIISEDHVRNTPTIINDDTLTIEFLDKDDWKKMMTFYTETSKVIGRTPFEKRKMYQRIIETSHKIYDLVTSVEKHVIQILEKNDVLQRLGWHVRVQRECNVPNILLSKCSMVELSCYKQGPFPKCYDKLRNDFCRSYGYTRDPQICGQLIDLLNEMHDFKIMIEKSDRPTDIVYHFMDIIESDYKKNDLGTIRDDRLLNDKFEMTFIHKKVWKEITLMYSECCKLTGKKNMLNK